MLFERDIFQVLKDVKDNYDSISQISDNDLFEIIENTLQNIYILTDEHLEFIKKVISREKHGITDNEIAILVDRVAYLKNVPQPEQRTPEWFEFRRDRLTASTISNIVGVGHFGNIKDIIKDKCGCSKVYRSGVATEHGVKYEDVACSIYADKTNSIVKEYGCIPHDTHKFLGASPDGITEQGRALEIKCPYSRKQSGHFYFELSFLKYDTSARAKSTKCNRRDF